MKWTTILTVLGIFGASCSFAQTTTSDYPDNQLIFCFEEGTEDSIIQDLRLLYNAVQLDSTFPSNCRLWEISFPVHIPGQSNPLIHIQEIKSHASQQTEVEAVGENFETYIPATSEEPPCAALVENQCPGDTNTVLLALVDSGIEVLHPFFGSGSYFWSNTAEIPGNGIDDDENGYIDDSAGYDFVEDDPLPQDMESHGTHLAGIIVQMIGQAGPAALKIMNLRTQDQEGYGALFAAIKASDYAITKGAEVINMSLTYSAPLSIVEPDTILPPLKHAIQVAAEYDALLVAAAGNDASDIDQTPYYPAAFDNPNIISVAATDCHHNLAWFSNYGQLSVDLAAWGVDVYSTVPFGSTSGNGWDYKSGTSMAAAFVSATGGLIKTQNPGLSYQDVKSQILMNVSPQLPLSGVVLTGGVLNTSAACLVMPRSIDSSGPADQMLRDVSIYPNPFQSNLHLEINGDQAGAGKLSIFDMLGRTIRVERLVLAKGENTHIINTTGFREGSYILQIELEGRASFFLLLRS